MGCRKVFKRTFGIISQINFRWIQHCEPHPQRDLNIYNSSQTHPTMNNTRRTIRQRKVFFLFQILPVCEVRHRALRITANKYRIFYNSWNFAFMTDALIRATINFKFLESLKVEMFKPKKKNTSFKYCWVCSIPNFDTCNISSSINDTS